VTLFAAPVHAACTIQLSETGEVPLASGEQRMLTWPAVPGATSYFVERIFAGVGNPKPGDFGGGVYVEERNIEQPASNTSVMVSHIVLVDIAVRYRVTALNQSDASFQPCSASVLYRVSADARLASFANRLFVPIAGKANGAHGSSFITSLVLSGRGRGTHPNSPSPGTPDRFAGRIVFRPMTQTASDTDPSIPYEFNDDQSVIIDDVMSALGVTGIGSIEIIPEGGPSPIVEAVIKNVSPDGKRYGVRLPAILGRDQMSTRLIRQLSAVVRDPQQVRLSVGVRAFGSAFVRFHLISENGDAIAAEDRFPQYDAMTLYSMQDVFGSRLKKGMRVLVDFTQQIGPSEQHGGFVFLTETDNKTNDPGVIVKDYLFETRYSQGYDPFVIQ
jgi:hypothetical protein